MDAKLMLMIPGPTPVPEQVLLDMAKHPVGHRSKEFMELIGVVTQKLKWLHQTKNDVLILTVSGTGAVEAGIINFFSPGDRVLVLLPRIVPWWETLVGLLKAGLVAMPGTALLTPRDLEYRLKISEAVAVITDDEGADKIDSISEQPPALRHRILVSNDRRRRCSCAIVWRPPRTSHTCSSSVLFPSAARRLDPSRAVAASTAARRRPS